MNKEKLVVLGVIGTPFLCAGMLLGGYVVKKIDEYLHKQQIKIWGTLTTTLSELLEDSWKKNDELKKKLSEKEA